MEKENNQAAELQQMVDAWSAMNRFAFYTGVQRGLMSAMNVIFLKYVGMSFEAYTKAAFKPQVHQMASVGTIITLLANGLKEIDDLIKLAMSDAQKDVENEKKEEKGGNNEKDKSGKLAE